MQLCCKHFFRTLTFPGANVITQKRNGPEGFLRVGKSKFVLTRKSGGGEGRGGFLQAILRPPEKVEDLGKSLGGGQRPGGLRCFFGGSSAAVKLG